MFFLIATFAWFPQLPKPRELGQGNGKQEGKCIKILTFAPRLDEQEFNI